MALLIRMLYQSYSNFVERHEDSHLENYPLMGSPLKIIALSAGYWMFVNKWGPKFMRNRRPYGLKKSMQVYNLLQVLANAYVACITTQVFFGAEYVHWGCNTTHTKFISSLSYYYFMLKVLDYTDTIFMVLRKCNKQITFLHVYHHVIMALGACVGVRLSAGGTLIVLGYVNTWVHTIMYLYYFLTAFRPELKASLWWKKHITQLQIVQFLYLMLHFGRKLFRADCDKLKVLLMFVFLQNMFMAFMFIDFYIKAYVKKPKRSEVKG